MTKRTVVDWYLERAEWFGTRVFARMQNFRGVLDDDYTRELAMLAAHFGGLVLGYASLQGKHITVMDLQVVQAPAENYFVPPGCVRVEGHPPAAE